MKDKIIELLGANYDEEKENALNILITNYKIIASNHSSLSKNNTRLEPYVMTAVLSAYERLGATGASNATEGSISYSFIDIEEKLKKDVMVLRRFT